MKKLLLGLGSIASVVAPVAAVVSCGDDSTTPGTNGTQGTEGHTVTISDNAVVTAVGNGLNAALGLTATNVGAVVAGDNLNLSLGTSGTKSLNFAHYTKITFTAADTITTGLTGNGATVAVNAGDSLVIGIPAAQRRTAAPAAADLKVVLMGKNGTNMKIAVDTAKLATLKSGVLDKVVEHMEAQNPDAGNGSGSTASTVVVDPRTVMINPTKATQVTVSGGKQADGATMPTHLTKEFFTPAMDAIKALTGIENVTELVYTAVVSDTTDKTNPVTTMKTFTITFAAGKATDVDALVAAASTVTGVDVTVPGGGTGGSGSTGTPSTADVTVALGKSSGTAILLSDLKTQVMNAIGANQPANVKITIDSATINVALTA